MKSVSRRDSHLDIRDLTRETPHLARHFAAIRRAEAEGHDVGVHLTPLLFRRQAPAHQPPGWLTPLLVDVGDALDVAHDGDHRRVIVKRLIEEVHQAITDAPPHFTPDAVVDTMWRLAADLLQRHFGIGLADAELIDPFAGSAVYADRLIRRQGVSGITSFESHPGAARAGWLVVREALIDTDLGERPRVSLADTFQLALPPSERPRVIIGTPPPERYAEACRWAEAQLGPRGLFISVGPRSVLGTRPLRELRGHMRNRFDQIRVIDLRGKQRSSGEVKRAEGGAVFGSGFPSGVSIVARVRGVEREPVRLHALADGLHREEKLARLAAIGGVDDLEWSERDDVLAPDDELGSTRQEERIIRR